MSTSEGPWLRSASFDLSWFVFPGIASVLLILVMKAQGIVEGPHDDLPPWAWLATVVAIDVAHVYATIFRVYLDRAELRRRAIYFWAPLLAWLLGIVLYAVSERVFWSALAYLAVFHFVKQQEGFVRLYRAKAGERGRADLLWDRLAVYAMTFYPLFVWHAHLPRAFHWFRNRDFVALALDPALVETIVSAATVAYWTFLAVYSIRAAIRVLSGRSPWNPGKWGVLLATWACWYVGIVPFDSDLAFTITNVVLHGVPYLGLVLLVGSRKQASGGALAYEPGSLAARIFSLGARGFVLALLLLLALALLEEGAWDKLVWHEHGTVFGEALRVSLGPFLAIVVPLLSVPQTVHYFLDGLIWKLDGSNPGLDVWLGIRPRT